MLTITAKIKLELYIYILKNQGIYMFLPFQLLFYSAMVWGVVCVLEHTQVIHIPQASKHQDLALIK